MKMITHVKAGTLTATHKETLVRDVGHHKGLCVKTKIRAGGITLNHNETLVWDTLWKIRFT
jgi:hypothetical protein